MSAIFCSSTVTYLKLLKHLCIYRECILMLRRGEVSWLKYLVEGVFFAELLWFGLKYLEIATNVVSSIFQFRKE